MERAVFAGGCFWCTEAVFKRLKGVTKVTSGYANGNLESPTYGDVSSGETGFAESVEIEYDPKIISYDKLLDIFWVTHDPTSLNRQGADVGTQYRSAIYFVNDEQKERAESSKREIPGSVTEIAPLKNFYTAEEYHQNYFERNASSNPYCSIVIAPKIKNLLEKFNSEVKEEYKKE